MLQNSKGCCNSNWDDRLLTDSAIVALQWLCENTEAEFASLLCIRVSVGHTESNIFLVLSLFQQYNWFL